MSKLLESGIRIETDSRFNLLGRGSMTQED